jgi:hypothetical protein
VFDNSLQALPHKLNPLDRIELLRVSLLVAVLSFIEPLF